MCKTKTRFLADLATFWGSSPGRERLPHRYSFRPHRYSTTPVLNHTGTQPHRYSCRAHSGRLNFTVWRHKFNKNSLLLKTTPVLKTTPGLETRAKKKRRRQVLVFKAHRRLYHSTLGLRVIKKKTRRQGFEREPESRNVKQFRGGLVFKADRLLYHSTLVSMVMKQRRRRTRRGDRRVTRSGCLFQCDLFLVQPKMQFGQTW